MQKAIQLLCAVLMLCAPALADALKYTYYSQPRIMDASIGNNGALAIVAAPNYGGTGLSAGTITLLDAQGLPQLTVQPAHAMGEARVAASDASTLRAALSTEATAPGSFELVLRVWNGTTLAYYAALRTQPAGGFIGDVHIDKDGKRVVYWTMSGAYMDFATHVLDTTSWTTQSYKHAAFPIEPTGNDRSHLSDDGTTLAVVSPGYTVLFHVDPDDTTAISRANGDYWPRLFDTVVNNGQTQHWGFAVRSKTSLARLRSKFEGGIFRMQLTLDGYKVGDWNLSQPNPPCEWGWWSWTNFETNVPFPIGVALSPNGRTVALPMLTHASGLGQLSIIDLQPLPLQWIPTGLTVTQTLSDGGGNPYTFERVEFLGDDAIVGIANGPAQPVKVRVWRKDPVNSQWAQSFDADFEISDNFHNRLHTCQAGVFGVSSWGVSGRIVGSWLRVYEVGR